MRNRPATVSPIRRSGEATGAPQYTQTRAVPGGSARAQRGQMALLESLPGNWPPAATMAQSGRFHQRRKSPRRRRLDPSSGSVIEPLHGLSPLRRAERDGRGLLPVLRRSDERGREPAHHRAEADGGAAEVLLPAPSAGRAAEAVP